MAIRISKAEDCRGVLFDAYEVDGEAFDKTLIDLGRSRSRKDKKESAENYIRRTELRD